MVAGNHVKSIFNFFGVVSYTIFQRPGKSCDDFSRQAFSLALTNVAALLASGLEMQVCLLSDKLLLSVLQRQTKMGISA